MLSFWGPIIRESELLRICNIPQKILSTSKPMSLFQLLLSLILCVSAATSPARGPCETQVTVVNSQFFNTVFFFFPMQRPPKASDHTACCSQPEWEVEVDLQCVTTSFLWPSSRLPATGITRPRSRPWLFRTAGHSCTLDWVSPSSRWKTSSRWPLDSCRWSTTGILAVMSALIQWLCGLSRMKLLYMKDPVPWIRLPV